MIKKIYRGKIIIYDEFNKKIKIPQNKIKFMISDLKNLLIDYYPNKKYKLKIYIKLLEKKNFYQLNLFINTKKKIPIELKQFMIIQMLDGWGEGPIPLSINDSYYPIITFENYKY